MIFPVHELRRRACRQILLAGAQGPRSFVNLVNVAARLITAQAQTPAPQTACTIVMAAAA